MRSDPRFQGIIRADPVGTSSFRARPGLISIRSSGFRSAALRACDYLTLLTELTETLHIISQLHENLPAGEQGRGRLEDEQALGTSQARNDSPKTP